MLSWCCNPAGVKSTLESPKRRGAALLKHIGVAEEELTPATIQIAIGANKTPMPEAGGFLQSSLVDIGAASFFGQPEASAPKSAYDCAGLGTPPGGRNKGLAMSDAGQHRRVQAKLRELIERAASAADANFNRGIKPCPLGFAVRANGSKFIFEPVNIEHNDAVAALIRTLFLQHHVVCYVLTLGAVSEGKQYVLFSAEDESGALMFGQREIITQPAPHLGPLEIIVSNFAEGRFVGLLPRQAMAGAQ